jgi:hypothetical protein
MPHWAKEGSGLQQLRQPSIESGGVLQRKWIRVPEPEGGEAGCVFFNTLGENNSEAATENQRNMAQSAFLSAGSLLLAGRHLTFTSTGAADFSRLCSSQGITAAGMAVASLRPRAVVDTYKLPLGHALSLVGLALLSRRLRAASSTQHIAVVVGSYNQKFRAERSVGLDVAEYEAGGERRLAEVTRLYDALVDANQHATHVGILRVLAPDAVAANQPIFSPSPRTVAMSFGVNSRHYRLIQGADGRNAKQPLFVHFYHPRLADNSSLSSEQWFPPAKDETELVPHRECALGRITENVRYYPLDGLPIMSAGLKIVGDGIDAALAPSVKFIRGQPQAAHASTQASHVSVASAAAQPASSSSQAVSAAVGQPPAAATLSGAPAAAAAATDATSEFPLAPGNSMDSPALASDVDGAEEELSPEVVALLAGADALDAAPSGDVHRLRPVSIQTYSASFRNRAGGKKLACDHALSERVANPANYTIADPAARGGDVFRSKKFFDDHSKLLAWRREYWNDIKRNGETYRLEAAFIDHAASETSAPYGGWRPVDMLDSTLQMAFERVLAYPAETVAEYRKAVLTTEEQFAKAAQRVFDSFKNAEEQTAAGAVVRHLMVIARLSSSGFVGTALNDCFQPQIAQLSNRMFMLWRMPHQCILAALGMTVTDLHGSTQFVFSKSKSVEHSSAVISAYEGYGEPAAALQQKALDAVARFDNSGGDPSMSVRSVHDQECNSGGTDFPACGHKDCLLPFQTQQQLKQHHEEYPTHKAEGLTAYINVRDAEYVRLVEQSTRHFDPEQQRALTQADKITATCSYSVLPATAKLPALTLSKPS